MKSHKIERTQKEFLKVMKQKFSENHEEIVSISCVEHPTLVSYKKQWSETLIVDQTEIPDWNPIYQ